jgi:hypothetical protein
LVPEIKVVLSSARVRAGDAQGRALSGAPQDLPLLQVPFDIHALVKNADNFDLTGWLTAIEQHV